MSYINTVGAGSGYYGATSASAPPSQNIADIFKQAIKDYQDEQLTGLTDEEKAEIDRLCNEYLKKNPMNTDAQKESFREFYKSLLRRFGFKGDIEGDGGDKNKGSSEAENSAADANMKSLIESIQGSAPGARFLVKRPT